MDQSELRKNFADCRHSTYSSTLPSGQKTNKKKSKHKNSAYHLLYPQSCDGGFASYAFNLPPQARIHPPSQRLFQPLDPSICHYQVPLSFSLEHVSLPVYSTVFQPGAASSPPLEQVIRINRTSEQKSNRVQTYKQNNELEQDCLSLPPANCDLNSKKPKGDDANCKRRFSDPGVAQISSDECNDSRSSGSNNSSIQDLHMPYAYGLIEQVNELRESNSHLTRELHETKLELESLKVLSASWRQCSENLQPGKLSDSIVEVREAIKVNEDALLSKVMHLFENNATQCNEAHRKLEEKLCHKLSERLAKLEDQVQRLAERPPEESSLEDGGGENALSIQQQLVDSEREKLMLRKELQEAIDSRKKAEANTQKLERLVGLLRKKINGVSFESTMSEEKQNAVRPLAVSFEQNPFVAANNRHAQKVKRGLSHRKPESTEGGESKEEPEVSSGLTITGPVTDL